LFLKYPKRQIRDLPFLAVYLDTMDGDNNLKPCGIFGKIWNVIKKVVAVLAVVVVYVVGNGFEILSDPPDGIMGFGLSLPAFPLALNYSFACTLCKNQLTRGLP